MKIRNPDLKPAQKQMAIVSSGFPELTRASGFNDSISRMFRFHRISVRGSLLTHHPPPRSGQGRFPRLASLASVFEGAQPAYSSSFLLDIGGRGIPST